jgi:AAA domain
MKIVSVINYKGGVGKTALTANLAAELAWHDKRILMLDLDPQTSLTFSFILPGGRAQSPRRSAAPDRRPLYGGSKPHRLVYRAPRHGKKTPRRAALVRRDGRYQRSSISSCLRNSVMM